MADELVDRRQQAGLAIGEVLPRCRTAAGVNDRDEIVHTHIPPDELLGCGTDGCGSPRVRLDAVEHEEDDPAVEIADIRTHVGFDGGAAK